MKKLILPLVMLAAICFSFTIQDWYKYSSKEGSYEILMPKMPLEQQQSIETEFGKLKLNMVMYDASEDREDNYIYLVNYTDYPPEMVNSEDKELINDFLESFINVSASNVNGEIVENKDIQKNGFPGKEVKIELEMDAAVINMQVLLVKNRMYMLQVITTPDKLNNANALKFFNSFKLT